MKIAVLDDEIKNNQYLSKLLINHLFNSNHEDYQISEYVSGLDFLHELTPGAFDIIFLDVMMPVLNGFEIAEKIREIDLYVDIIFVTSMVNDTQVGYDYNAKGYLHKPVNQEQISRLMERLQLEYQRRSDIHSGGLYEINIKRSAGGGKYLLRLSDVLYFEGAGNDTISKTLDDSFIFWKKLGDVESELEGKGFLRIHQSFLVNKSKIFQNFGKHLVLRNGETIPISRRYQKLVREELEIV